MTQTESVVLTAMILALVGLAIVVLTKMLFGNKKGGEIDLSKSGMKQMPKNMGAMPEPEGPVTVRASKKIDGRPVYFFPVPGNQQKIIFGWLERTKGRRAIIRLHSGKRVRRMAYLVYQLNGHPLRPAPVSKQERIEATAYLVDLERKFESAAA